MIALNSHPGSSFSPFEPGQLVRHVRYGYRGVVVQRDDACLASEQWYQGNQTQPDRNQPWYHVLVNDSTSCTYAAAENLVADESEEPINHPLVTRFFDGMSGGKYVRNDQPWPS
ncbi:MAG: heat shock protein HspQ [Pirellulales bacterium]|nr:heat shock protein HspQ [Pirellulales bacterium]